MTFLLIRGKSISKSLPSCDESKIVDECNPPTEPTARLVSSGEFNKWIIQFSISSFQINVESPEVTRVND